MNNLEFLQVYGLYLGTGGLAAGATIVLICGLLRFAKWSPVLAKWISRILTVLGLLAAMAIMLGFGVWMWVDDLSKLTPQQNDSLLYPVHEQGAVSSVTTR